MKRIKWENIVFIILVSCYVYNALSINDNVLQTLAIQIGTSYIVKLAIKYIRVNWKQVKEDIRDTFIG